MAEGGFNNYTAVWIKEHIELVRRGYGEKLYEEWEKAMSRPGYNHRLTRFLQSCLSLEDIFKLFKNAIPEQSFFGLNTFSYIIPEHIDTVGIRGFGNSPHLKQVMFRGDISHIDEYAFGNCPSLVAIYIGRPSWLIIEASSVEASPLSIFVFDGKKSELDSRVSISRRHRYDPKVRIKCTDGVVEL
jgi:hypothetical protein